MDNEVTKREIYVSTIIICIMLIIGKLIVDSIVSSVTEKAFELETAVQVYDDETFAYIKSVNAGTFLAEGSLISNEIITLPELSGQYSKIKKVKEEYMRHTRTVTKTNEKGETYTEEETYYEWDHVKTEEFVTQSFSFLNQRFTAKELKYSIPTDYEKTIYKSSDIRYCYYTAPVVVNGTIIGNADEKCFKETEFLRNKTIESVIKCAEKRIDNAPIIFWIIWSALITGLIVLFVKFENDWLNK